MAHIQHRPGGRLPYVVRYSPPGRKEASKSFATKREAKAFAAKQETDAARGIAVDPRDGAMTFEAWAATWSAGRVDLRKSTRARDDSYLRSLILPTFGPVSLNTIQRPELQAWVSDLMASGLAAGTVRKAFQIAAAILGAAERERLIGRSPASDVRLPKDERDEVEVLTPEQVATVADTIDPRYRALVLTAAHTGLRWGELAGLEVGDLDLLGRRLTVRRTLIEVSGKIDTNPPKTRAGRRTVALPGAVADILGEHLAGHSGDSVFTAPRGGPLRRSSWRPRFWLPAVKAAGLQSTTFHALRHSHASFLIAQGIDVVTIANRLGHRDSTVTLAVYGHLMPGRDRAAADAIDQIFDGVAPNPSENVTPIGVRKIAQPG